MSVLEASEDCLRYFLSKVKYSAQNLSFTHHNLHRLPTRPKGDTHHIFDITFAQRGQLMSRYRKAYATFGNKINTWQTEEYKRLGHTWSIEIGKKLRLSSFYWLFQALVRCQTSDCISASSSIMWLLYVREIPGLERIELVGYFEGRVPTHAFLLINRAPSSLISDYRTWGNQCILLDPWLRLCFYANRWPEFRPFMQPIPSSNHPNLELINPRLVTELDIGREILSQDLIPELKKWPITCFQCDMSMNYGELICGNGHCQHTNSMKEELPYCVDCGCDMNMNFGGPIHSDGPCQHTNSANRKLPYCVDCGVALGA